MIRKVFITSLVLVAGVSICNAQTVIPGKARLRMRKARLQAAYGSGAKAPPLGPLGDLSAGTSNIVGSPNILAPVGRAEVNVYVNGDQTVIGK